MEGQNNIYQNILKITIKIKEEFPELIKHLNEVPIKFSDAKSKGINNKNLIDYYNTLVDLVDSYGKHH
ncbi:MAG: hypothetical protein ACI89R_001006 [Candidatus Azotimanducaceae bacterium]|jgi:hypothetical protein